ncbi:MAG: helix-turn-helix transcriptional regulator [Chloroflexi bacterium]|nr:helix-turn-helix transcriptional regulator [Chloroflexota bacterium]
MPASPRPENERGPSTGSARGPIQFSLLALLYPEPRHGYELHGLFEAALGGHWTLNTGQIYSSLERLERDGLVSEAGLAKGGRPDKRTWALTLAGRAALSNWFQSAVRRDDRLRDELYLKMVLALVTRAENPQQLLQVQRREMFRELHSLTAERNRANPGQELARILMLDSAIMHTEAELRWLDLVETRLDEIRGQPLPAPQPRPRGRPPKRRPAPNRGEADETAGTPESGDPSCLF